MTPRNPVRLALLVALNLQGVTLAADIVIAPPAAGGVAITNAAGNATRFRVADDGTVSLPGLTALPVAGTGLCIDAATGRIGSCPTGGGGSGGTVTSIIAGTGLTGGTITTSGTIGLANGGVGTTQLADGSVTLAKIAANGCTNGQVLRFNGAGWACATIAAGTGTVTSVATGAGLTGGPITATGTIALAATQLLPTTACAANQVPKWNGSAWACAADATGAVNGFAQGGNAFGAAARIGTLDNHALILIAGEVESLRIVPNPFSPSLIGGQPVNSVPQGTAAATIGGGGIAGNSDPVTAEACTDGCQNRVTDHGGTVAGGVANRAGNAAGTENDAAYPTVSGGMGNVAGDAFATVGGGSRNLALGNGSTIGGGASNSASGASSYVGGGSSNSASQSNSSVAGGSGNAASGLWTHVGGGQSNIASGSRATVLGGFFNQATSPRGSVGGGESNLASGYAATVPGGSNNLASGQYSLAGGRRAKTQDSGGTVHDGAFVWADATPLDFHSTAANEFSVRATGGVRFVTAVDGSGSPTASFAFHASGLLGLPANAEVYRGASRFLHANGANNTFLGTAAGNAVSSGFENAALGHEALLANTTGAGNTAAGYRAMASMTSGFNSTAVGAQALTNATGGGNIALGAFAGFAITTGANNIAIGNQGIAGDSDTMRLGAGQTRAFIAGVRGVTTGINNAVAVFVDSDGQLGTASSSRRVKDDIADMGEASEALMQLRPVSFHYRSHLASGQASRQYGLIAEEVAQVAPELVAHAADGSIETVNYHFLAPMLVNEVQKQHRTIQAQREEIAALRAEMADVKRALGLSQ